MDSRCCFFLLLRRLADGTRVSSLALETGYSRAIVSAAINTTSGWIMSRWGHKLQLSAGAIAPEKVDSFCAAIHARSEPNEEQNVAAFIDGTLLEIYRPSINQEEYYNGWKKRHYVKYQVVVTPDGIIIDLDGPHPGRKHDFGVLRLPGGYLDRAQHLQGTNGPAYTYGDSGYYPGRGLIKARGRATRRGGVSEEVEALNAAMSRSRVVVENIIGRVNQLWKILEQRYSLKIHASPLADLMGCCFFLTNCITCIDTKNVVSDSFGNATPPPTLGAYLEYPIATLDAFLASQAGIAPQQDNAPQEGNGTEREHAREEGN